MKTIQNSRVISDQGRQGRVESDDSRLNLELEEEGLTPEHLFAAAYAACFHSALRSAADRSHIDIEGSTVSVEARLEEEDNGAYVLSAEVRASIPGVARGEGEKLLNQAHDHCPYSRMSRQGIKVTLGLD